jgi:CRP-like cAMP-binding protein
MTRPTKDIRVVAALALGDGRIELFDALGKSVGIYARLDNRQARLNRAHRELASAEYAVIAYIARRCRGHQGVVRATDDQLAQACQLSVPTIFRARGRLRRAGLLTWRNVPPHGNEFRMTP